MAISGAYNTRPTGPRMAKNRLFLLLCIFAAVMSILILLWLLISIIGQGAGMLSWSFLTSLGSKDVDKAGFLPPLIGSVCLLGICALTAIPLGIGTAILLEEFKPKNPALVRIHGFVQLNITNLAGVPSIVYGILGLTAFANVFGVLGTPMDPSFAIGQKWYQEYADASGRLYYVPVNSREVPLKPAEAGMTFLTAPRSGAEVAQVTIEPEAKLAPLKLRIEKDLESIEETIVTQLDATRETRRGPVHVDQATAQRIADEAFAGTALKADTQELKALTVTALAAMNGKTGRELRQDRRDLFQTLSDKELGAVDLTGFMIAGTIPNRKDVKSWYFLQLPFGRGVLAGGLTLMLVILPIIIVASQESIRAVPMSQRHGSLALGSTKWQSVSKVVLPAAVPGIMTGTILAMSRAIGEAAPILMLGGVFITFLPSNVMDGFTAMPLQIFNWAGKPQQEFRSVAAAGIIVLLVVLLSFNALAVFIRQKAQKSY